MNKRSNRETRFSILIVCEGGKTEPLYFCSLRSNLISKKVWTNGVRIKISPEPEIDTEEIEKESSHKTKRKKRVLRETKIEKEERVKIEEEFKAIPLRFVREAQMGLEDGTYDEAWAVFDHDDHPKRKEAFELAQVPIEDKYVNIAFSSRSFEQWLLLHFEKSQKSFQESSCKEPDNKNRLIHCDPNFGCKGDICLWGRLRHYQELANSGKNSDVFYVLQPKLYTAFSNAIWLRGYSKQIEGNFEIYDRNPYTNVDRLVRRLFLPYEKVNWIKYDEYTELENIVGFSFHIEGNVIQLFIENKGSSYLLIREDNFELISPTGTIKNLELRYNLNVGENKKIALTSIDDIHAKNSILIYKNGKNAFVLEI